MASACGSDGAPRPTDNGTGDHRITLGEARSATTEEVEPPIPLLPAWSAEAPSHDQSKIVVLIVAAFMALA